MSSLKRKIFNDPVYGFVTIPYDIILDLIEHPAFQRLRRIQQLGLTSYVYPGGLHTRFQHAIGAMHLMGKALAVLRSKGHEISEEEAEAVTIAILLHDIGHGPFSHTLEKGLVTGLSHEDLSEMIMNNLNAEFGKRLTMAISIFKGKYKKRFLHQLVSSQLDMDRLDYLNRDSFFTGVYEGVIGYDRIIEMLNIVNDNIVVDAKGIYSIEKFIIARRLMYWQVYLHKAVVGAEQALVKVLIRAKGLTRAGHVLFATDGLQYFLINDFKNKTKIQRNELLQHFYNLDDNDIIVSLKAWKTHKDKVLSKLCKIIIDRELLKIEFSAKKPGKSRIDQMRRKAAKKYDISYQDSKYFVFSDSTSNYAYNPLSGKINLLFKDGMIIDIAKASDQLNISVLSNPVTKYYLCYPKDI